MKLGWYLRRMRRMSAPELAARVATAARQTYWAIPASRPSGLTTLKPDRQTASVSLPRQPTATEPHAARATIAAADTLLSGHWPIFNLPHAKVGPIPDWFRDPLTGIVIPHDQYAFSIRYRDESRVGNIKYVWEPSRHQAITVLAAAWWLTGNDAYAEHAARQLTNWWQTNPFLQGIHWISGIEVGLRLLAWSWIRALLSDWPGVTTLFDDNELFIRQLYHHQLFIRTFHSRGSSANNHLIAELAGLATASVAFPWFRESASWAAWSRTRLVQQAAIQTDQDGVNREQASDYHLFVLEILIAATLPARMAGQPFPAAFDTTIQRMADALAASVDQTGRPPRFGDADDGRGVLLDAPTTAHTAIVLDAANALYAAPTWWPQITPSILGHLTSLIVGTTPPPRTSVRPDTFADAGITILRAGNGPNQLWLRCDAGPHGFLSTASHGHADALSLELRHGGVDILADPGTYCYHGQPAWRGYFKGTRAHNTLTIDNTDQAVNGGPFLWLTHPATTLAAIQVGPDHPVQTWQASHDGYRRLADKVIHHRKIELHRDTRLVTIQDWIEAELPHDILMTYHLGLSIDVVLNDSTASLRWPDATAVITLPPELNWSVHRGEESPPFGWYSNGFGHKTPSYVLAGRGRLSANTALATEIAFPSI